MTSDAPTTAGTPPAQVAEADRGGPELVRLDRVYLLSRLALAVIFFYHGLVPKLLFRSPQEIEMNSTFTPWVEESFALISSGVAEILISVLLLVCYRARFFNYAILFFGTAATLAIALMLPHLLTDAFNPFSTNVAIVGFAIINLLARRK